MFSEFKIKIELVSVSNNRSSNYRILADQCQRLNARYSDRSSKADPKFLERWFICIKGWGFALLILSHFSEISHENEIILSD